MDEHPELGVLEPGARLQVGGVGVYWLLSAALGSDAMVPATSAESKYDASHMDGDFHVYLLRKQICL